MDAKTLLLSLISEYSPSGAEGRVQDIVEATLRSSGFSTVRTKTGNVIGRMGRGPKVALVGHADTVPGVIPVTDDGYVVTGRGAVDAKGPLSSFLLCAQRFSMLHLAEDMELVVASVVSEEGDGRGAKELIDSGEYFDYVVIGEPSNLDGIVRGNRGRVELRVREHGVSAHAASHWLGINAAEAAIASCQALKKHLEKPGRTRFESRDVTLTKICSGTSGNVVPDMCEYTLDIRLPPADNPEQVVLAAKGLLRTSDIEVGESIPAVVTPENTTLVSALRKCLRRKGIPPRVIVKTGTSDMNLLARVSHEIVSYGPGDPRLEHTGLEKIEPAHVELASQVLLELSLELAGIPSKGASRT